MNLSIGSTGSDVAILQHNLTKLGFQFPVYGYFGTITQASVETFQGAHSLVVDGIVGPKTQAALALALATTGPVNPPSDGSELNPLYVDLYGGNEITSWDKLVAGKVRAISHKASEGTSIKDSLIKSRWPLMKQHGLLRQAYLFYRIGQGVDPQWNNFQSVVGDIWDADLPHELDLGEFDLPPSQQLWDESLGLLEKMEAATGKKPWVYGAWGLLGQYQLPKDFAQYGLSVADLSHRPPHVPSPWTTFVAHQYADDVNDVPGCGPGADLDYFNGTLDQFKAL